MMFTGSEVRCQTVPVLAGGSGEPERFGNDSAVDGRLRAIAKEGRAVQGEELIGERNKFHTAFPESVRGKNPLNYATSPRNLTTCLN